MPQEPSIRIEAALDPEEVEALELLAKRLGVPEGRVPSAIVARLTDSVESE